jgi:dTDP-4-dehydrorhamnose 3,5-epimerase
VELRESSLQGVILFTPSIYEDDRGFFLENFRLDKLEDSLGRDFLIKQSNLSLSHRGVLRGIHFAGVPNGQAKYVSVMSGEIVDYVIDLRLGSSTFGQWEQFELNSQNRHSLFIPEGFGHAFLAVADNTVVHYMVNEFFSPGNEFAINSLDPDIGLEFPLHRSELIISDKDLEAPSLEHAQQNQILNSKLEVDNFLTSHRKVSS